MTMSLQTAWDDVETTASLSESDQAATFRYMVFTDDGETEDDVRDYAMPRVPDVYAGLLFTKMDVKRKQEADDVWSITAYYESPASSFALPKLSAGETRWSIRNGGGSTVKRLYSLGLVSEHVSEDTGSNYKFEATKAERLVGISVGKDGKGFEVEGKDVSLGNIEISVETVVSNAEATGAYLTAASAAADANAINDNTWKVFAAETLRLIDFNASQRAGNNPDWDVAMTFVFSPSLTNIRVPNISKPIPAKKGQQLLDVMFAEKKVGKFSLSVPVRAAVHDWYPKINFASVLKV
jgi:hypothetical protein